MNTRAIPYQNFQQKSTDLPLKFKRVKDNKQVVVRKKPNKKQNRDKQPIHNNRIVQPRRSLEPPDFAIMMITRYRRRYIASANVFGNLTISDLLNSFIVANTATAGNSLFRAIRMRRISIWSPVVTQGTPVTILIIPIGLDSASNNYTDFPEAFTDSSQVLDIPATIVWKPIQSEPSGSWHLSNTTTGNLVSVTAPIGSIMDIDYEAIFNTQFATSTYTTVLVGATPGTIYTRTILTNFVPIAVNNI